ncbi:MAG TPA: hypothetical protein VFV99_24775 [Kofleriaceae bacterium]|nr:hypothetical protein [Kofleriaceae bacterium]
MRHLIALILVGSLISGCSFFMTRAPAKDPGTRPLDCEKSMVPPGADAVGAGALTLIGLGSIATKSDDTSTTTFVVAELALFGVVAVLAYSAYSGHKSVKRCRDLNALPATPVRE